VSAYQFIVCLGKHEVANLRTRVDRAQRLQRESIPEPDVLVRGAASSSQETPVERRPVYCLHSGGVLAELNERIIALANLPQHKFIVVAATGQHHVVVGTPPKAAHFLFVSDELLHVRAIGGTQIPHKNISIFTSTGH
jgi:hypothetical protein